MVGLVLVGHSRDLVEGLRSMLAQAAPSVTVTIAGGTATGALGTSAPIVEAAIREALASAEGGVVVFLDLGSAALAVEIALELLVSADRARVRVSDGPIVEGAVLAAVEAASGASLDRVVGVADGAGRVPKLPEPLQDEAPSRSGR